MKKISYIIMGLIIMIILIETGTVKSSTIIENCSDYHGDSMMTGYGKIAQGFKIGTSSENTYYNLDKIRLFGYSSNTNCNLTIYLRKQLNGEDIIKNQSMRFTTSPNYIDIYATNVVLFPSTNYYIVIDDGCYYNYVYLGSQYPRNEFLYDGGSGFRGYDTPVDMIFEIYGTKLQGTDQKNVTLITPTDGKKIYSPFVDFLTLLTNNITNRNATLLVWNETEKVIESTTNLQNNIDYVEKYFILPNENVYKWNFKLCDDNNCTSANNNFTINYTSITIGCVPYTCEDIGKTCGNWSNGCNGTLQCGNCPDIYTKKNHVNLLGCGSYCSGSCQTYTTEGSYSTFVPMLQNSYDYVSNYFGGQNYLNTLKWPYPDVNVTFMCGETSQMHTPQTIYTNYWDDAGEKHEIFHWFMRHYSEPTGSFYYSFEEGFTMSMGWCGTYPTDPRCDATYGDDPTNLSLYCTIGSTCNYETIQEGMLMKGRTLLNCDFHHCWKWFFKNIVAKKNGDKLDVIDVYSYLVNYVGNRSKVDDLLNQYLPYNAGINVSDLTPYSYTVPAEAYPNSQGLYCGDGICSDTENCSTCSVDCGICPLETDNTYPSFGNYIDNNYLLTTSGLAYFNVTVNNTNGTVRLIINGQNYTAYNISNNYSINMTLTTGTYTYYWLSYGNGTKNNINVSSTFNYIVNQSSNDNIYPIFVNTFTNGPVEEGGNIYMNSTIYNISADVIINIGHYPQEGYIMASPINISNSYYYNISNLTVGRWYYQYRGSGNGPNNNYAEDNVYSFEIYEANRYTSLIRNLMANYFGDLIVKNSSRWITIENRLVMNKTLRIYNLSNTIVVQTNNTVSYINGTINLTIEPNHRIILMDNYTLEETNNDTYDNSNIEITGIFINSSAKRYHIKNTFDNEISIRTSLEVECQRIENVSYIPKNGSETNISYTCSDGTLKTILDLNVSDSSNEIIIYYLNNNENIISEQSISYCQGFFDAGMSFTSFIVILIITAVGGFIILLFMGNEGSDIDLTLWAVVIIIGCSVMAIGMYIVSNIGGC